MNSVCPGRWDQSPFAPHPARLWLSELEGDSVAPLCQPLLPQGRSSADTVPTGTELCKGSIRPARALARLTLGPGNSWALSLLEGMPQWPWLGAGAGSPALAMRQGPATVDTNTSGLFMNSSICRDKPVCIWLSWFP